jgi:competence protein ComEC
MKIHFLNVGNGDCTIIQLPNNDIMMVDSNNARLRNADAKTDIENPLAYLESLTTNTSIIRYVQTHPEMDHMDGLYDLASKYSISNFWDTQNKRKKPSDFSYGFREIDWDKYQELRSSTNAKYFLRGTSSIVPDGGVYPYQIYVISPSNQLVEEANQHEDWNLLSFVIVLQYNNFKLLLGGDASDSAWQNIYDYAVNDATAKSLLSNVTVFKAPHHGRLSSYCGCDMLNLMKPKEIVISKGSVPGEQSAYNNYYNWLGNADHLYLTSLGTVIVGYDGQTSYTIGNKT